MDIKKFSLLNNRCPFCQNKIKNFRGIKNRYFCQNNEKYSAGPYNFHYRVSVVDGVIVYYFFYKNYSVVYNSSLLYKKSNVVIYGLNNQVKGYDLIIDDFDPNFPIKYFERIEALSVFC